MSQEKKELQKNDPKIIEKKIEQKKNIKKQEKKSTKFKPLSTH